MMDLGFVLDDPEIQGWLQANMEKLYLYPRWRRNDFANAIMPAFDYMKSKVTGGIDNVATGNITNGKLAPDPEQFLITGLYHALWSPTASTSAGVLADQSNLADARRLLAYCYILELKTGQGSEIWTGGLHRIPEGVAPVGSLSTGGGVAHGWQDIRNALPFYYPVAKELVLQANMSPLGLDLANPPVVPTLPITIRGELGFYGVRFRTQKRG